MSSISEQIMKQAEILPEGALLRPKDFLHLGSRPAIHQAFSRLARQDVLRRIFKGIYVRTIETRFGRCSPKIGKVIEALSKLWGETIVYSAGSSANFLGLTTQISMREVYFTSGPSRRLRFQALEVDLRHAPSWQLVGENRPPGVLVRALTFLHPDETEEALAKVLPRFSETDMAELMVARAVLPEWIAQPLGDFINHD